MRPLTKLAFFVSLAFFSTFSHAYVGPGVGVGTGLVLLGVLASVVIAVIGLVYFPIKRRLRGKKKSSKK